MKESANENVIKASEFKAKCLKLMDTVSESGEELTITKNGTPIAKLVPYTRTKTLHGIFKDDIQIIGDIMEPIDVEWEVLRDDEEPND